jgi:lipoprotein signal peptidase
LTQNLAKLVTILPKEPFQKWGLNFIGLVKPTSRMSSNWYNMVAIDYATKWVEVRTLRSNIVVVITKFLYKHILIRFGCPWTIVTDQSTHFIMMQSTTSLTILFKNIPFFIFIIHKEMDRLSLQTRFLEPY